jgi:hypothetical protein
MPAAAKKKRSATKPKAEDALPAAQDWRSTDEQEIFRRQLRAREETMRIRNLFPKLPVFSNFAVRWGIVELCRKPAPLKA